MPSPWHFAQFASNSSRPRVTDSRVGAGSSVMATGVPGCSVRQRGEQQRFSTLTPREREVLPLVVSGLLNKQAAAELGISEVTLQIHRGKIMHKMEAGSFAELVRMAGTLGISLTHGRRAHQ